MMMMMMILYICITLSIILINVNSYKYNIGNGIRCIKNKSIKTNDVNFKKYSNSNLKMVDDVVPVPEDGKFDPAAWLNPNTRGGVIVWSFLLILIPIGFYQYFTSQGIEDTTVGAYVGAIFVLLTNLLWASTYIFRVANKDMTYAKQLKDYENAVLQKRLEELADDEINALMEEIEAETEKDESK